MVSLVVPLGVLHPHERSAISYQKPDGACYHYHREAECHVQEHALIERNRGFLILSDRSLQLEHSLPQGRHEHDEAPCTNENPNHPIAKTRASSRRSSKPFP